jgi:hypothetical protein
VSNKAVPVHLEAESDACFTEYNGLLRRTAEAAAKWGAVLSKIRETSWGTWERWFKDRYDLSPDTALRHMKLAERWEEVRPQFDANPRMSPSAGLKLLRRLDGETGAERKAAPGALARRFKVPPFSVLDARSGPWQERKRAWVAWVIDGAQGREGHAACSIHHNTGARTSVFDPVLAEVTYYWFALPGGSILDPFAGESVKGLVAAHEGLTYTGVELRPEQVEANRRQAKAVGLAPTWIVGDSNQLNDLLPAGETYDFILTSPPYYDLEEYSTSPQDGSTFPTYEKFMGWLGDVFRQCVERLRGNRFLVVKVGEIRNERGGCRGFVADTTTLLRGLGLVLYNELVLLTPLGSLPIRVGQHFPGARKVGRAHQTVLVFWKGDPRDVAKHFPALVADEAEEEQSAPPPARRRERGRAET